MTFFPVNLSSRVHSQESTRRLTHRANHWQRVHEERGSALPYNLELCDLQCLSLFHDPKSENSVQANLHLDRLTQVSTGGSFFDLTQHKPIPMAPDKPTNGKKRAGDTAVHKYSNAPKKVKPELSKEEKLKKKWKSLQDQVNDGFLENAYKTSKRSRFILIPFLLGHRIYLKLIRYVFFSPTSAVLEIDPDNHNAIQTHIQILLSLDRYKDALTFIKSQQQQSSDTGGQEEWQLEQAYALYKLGRVPEAATIIEALRAGSMQLDEDAEHARAVDVLDAQIVGASAYS